MDYLQLIKNWHERAANEDYFSKFVFEYLAFSAYLRKIKFSDAPKDRNALQRLKRDYETRNRYIHQLESDNDLKNAWEEIVRELGEARLGNASNHHEEVEELKWWNCSENNPVEQINAPLKGVIHNLEDWGNMVEFWSAVRNNLFHGSKDPANDRDNIMVKYGFITLQGLMNIFLRRENI